MWEEVIIEFTPDEHRYYYDSIRVVSPGSDPVVVPIHGYPVVNTAHFPTAIDFGKCSITETMTKVVPLSSSVPIEFEFELRILKPSAFFEVTPLQGDNALMWSSCVTSSRLQGLYQPMGR